MRWSGGAAFCNPFLNCAARIREKYCRAAAPLPIFGAFMLGAPAFGG